MKNMTTGNKYFHISPEKELTDTRKLCSLIGNEGWVDSSTILVNCFPDYSSSLTLAINHKLSYLNGNELYEVIPLEMPYPVRNQVWNPRTRQYENFDRYLKEWVENNTYDVKFLFINSGTLNGKNFNKLNLSLRGKLADYRFASLYLQDDCMFIPNYYVQKFNKPTQGGLLFHWENADNPNWE